MTTRGFRLCVSASVLLSYMQRIQKIYLKWYLINRRAEVAGSSDDPTSPRKACLVVFDDCSEWLSNCRFLDLMAGLGWAGLRRKEKQGAM